MTWLKIGDDFGDECARVGLSDAGFRTHVEALSWVMHRETGGWKPEPDLIARRRENGARRQREFRRRQAGLDSGDSPREDATQDVTPLRDALPGTGRVGTGRIREGQELSEETEDPFQADRSTVTAVTREEDVDDLARLADTAAITDLREFTDSVGLVDAALLVPPNWLKPRETCPDCHWPKYGPDHLVACGGGRRGRKWESYTAGTWEASA